MAADIEQTEKHKLLHESEISLMLDTYDDIFSDFDPRPYSERAISEDFRAELKRASRFKPSGIIELKLMIPHRERSLEKEKLVKKRLHEHFKTHFGYVKDEIRELQVKGAAIALIGFAIMISAVFIGDFNLSERLTSALLVVLEPAGWFTMWFGFDKVLYTAGGKKPDADFYEKMSKCIITFLPY
ncbi:MAG: hypothetical protein QXH80_02335 [Candidatus Nanoarchaeia archaeon]